MKWEYKGVEWLELMKFTHSEGDGELVKLGNEGWELVTISEGYAIFKRPKSEEEEIEDSYQ